MTVPEAIDVAKGHLAIVLPEFTGALQLEELETPPAGPKWRFTFSATLPTASNATLMQVLRGRRIEKTVEIDPETGALLAVKNVAAA